MGYWVVQFILLLLLHCSGAWCRWRDSLDTVVKITENINVEASGAVELQVDYVGPNNNPEEGCIGFLKYNTYFKNQMKKWD